ncbi:cupin domain-containing protein [Bacillus sp. 31A1R]|uniref:Cupin domain-containing protein n=1 Tax=Robertmurraya mangrovi TaxID=3098077 RepID=A0ABU5J080_9BACI|nr:cupin domain-containing protein [Bacillus sp. 31A1R]MDZ5472819.1 cupin domain-containing protein [Bacillus sp. 31A1R]
MEKVNIVEKFSLFNEHWSPKIAGEVNNMHVKFAKLKGEFVWHRHEHEDEMFLVVKGKLILKFRDKEVSINEGEFIIVPKGVEHLPVAEEEVHVLLFEPKSTLNTGDQVNDRTVSNLQSI